jgi:hypothetical protein
MSTPFFERLKKYYSDIGKVLRGEADAASIFPNPTDVGISREHIYAEMLKLHLPSSCNVTLGGFLFDQDGNESSQIDILVTNDSSLRFNFYNKDGSGKSFACVDGCVGVVSVKSNLDSHALIDSLQNMASIPDKQPPYTLPLIQVKSYEDWPYKVIYASDGITLTNLLESLNEFYDEHPEVPFHKRPNLIHVAGKYVIVRIGEDGSRTRDGTILAPNVFYPMLETTDVLAFFRVISEIQSIVAASKYIRYEYGAMLDKIPL